MVDSHRRRAGGFNGGHVTVRSGSPPRRSGSPCAAVGDLQKLSAETFRGDRVRRRMPHMRRLTGSASIASTVRSCMRSGPANRRPPLTAAESLVSSSGPAGFVGLLTRARCCHASYFGAVPDGPDLHLQAAARHEEAAKNHDRAAAFWDGLGESMQAGLQRELAEYERQGAELERRWAALIDPKPADRAAKGAERTRSLTRTHAAHVSSALNRTADALEKAAAIAEEHGRRRERAGRPDSAAQEREAADRAREYAQRARSQAEGWLNPGGNRKA